MKNNWKIIPPRAELHLTFSKTVFVTNGKKIGFGYYNHAIEKWRTFNLDGEVIAWHDLIYPPVPEKGEI